MKPWSMEYTCPYTSTPYFGSIARAFCSKEKHLTPLVKLKSQYSLLQVFFKNKFNCNRFEHHIIINWLRQNNAYYTKSENHSIPY